MKKDRTKWTPALPILKQDNILSSRAREEGQKQFLATYEKEPRENMNFIMSNEYCRIWEKEHRVYDQETYSKMSVEAEAPIQRRYVLFKFVKPKIVREHPVMKIKKFENIACKTDHKQTKVK